VFIEKSLLVYGRGDPSLALGMTWHRRGIKEEAAIRPKMLGKSKFQWQIAASSSL
jgi:hypothetical protein